jgi:ubiquinone/menaquinone biosynthesis C-methylase UbiE
MTTNYYAITEYPGLKASKEQLARLYHRYHFALDYAGNKDVLEVACGTGIGLGYLASAARHVIGGDIDEKNVAIAGDLYKGNEKIDVKSLDAHNLNYPDQSVDLVLLYEAIYYLQDPTKFIAEAWRILRKGGSLIICTVNKDWIDFHPSQFTHQYFSVPELYQLLKENFDEIHIYGAFSTKATGLKSRGVSLLKRVATRFHLIPGSLAARSYLKRVFIGPLQPLPAQIQSGMASYEPSVGIAIDKPTADFKIVYAVAIK